MLFGRRAFSFISRGHAVSHHSPGDVPPPFISRKWCATHPPSPGDETPSPLVPGHSPLLLQGLTMKLSALVFKMLGKFEYSSMTIVESVKLAVRITREGLTEIILTV